MSTKLLFLCLFSVAFMRLSLSLAVTYSCPASSCPTGCCSYYSYTYAIADPTCALGSTYCSCSTATTCTALTSSSSSGYYAAGYRSCSTSYSTSGCCYYSISMTTSDYTCSSFYCSSASSYSCSSSGGSSSGGSSSGTWSSSWSDWTVADQLTLSSGNSYVVVNYSGWKAAVAIGAAIAGVWFFLDLWLLYYKCFAKPKNWVRP